MDPIIGLKGEAARAYLDRLKAKGEQLPTISRESAEAMRQGALNDRIAYIRDEYNKTKPPIAFDTLPGDVQTAIADWAYQTANPLGTNLWKQITTGQWDAAVNNLNHYYGPKAQPTPHDVQRRKDEAERIQRGFH